MADTLSQRDGGGPAHGGGKKGAAQGRGQKDSRPPKAGDGGPIGPWSDYWLAECKDGKVRRIGAGIQPLAYGVPGRVGRLRAYGNAIVPFEAAAFVKAAMGALEDRRAQG